MTHARISVLLVLSLAALPAARSFARDGDNSPAAYAANLRAAEEKTKAKEWPEAASLWQKVVQQNPTNAEFWGKLGLSCYSAKEYGRAIPAYEKAIQLGDGFPSVSQYNIACCYALSGDKGKALDALDRAMAMGFRDIEQLRKDTDLNQIRHEQRYVEWAANPDVSKMTRDEGWRFDLKLLARELKRIHINLRKGAPPAFGATVAKLNEDIPNLTDSQVGIGFMRLMRFGNDGHTGIRPMVRKRAPIQLFWFTEGVFVTAAKPEYKELIGQQVVRVGSRTTEQALKEVDPICARDNESGPKGILPIYFTNPFIMNGLGIMPDPSVVTLTVRDTMGKERAVEMKAEEIRDTDGWVTLSKSLGTPLPLYLKERTKPYWYEFQPDSKTLYCQYNAVQNDLRDPFPKFCERMFKFVNENEVQKFVLDLRWNGGGNTFLEQPLIHGLIKCEKLSQRGRLFVITGRNTFSAAQNCSVFIERNTKAIFVGEPSGSSPNFVGETVLVTLPYSKMVASISDLYWQSSWPMDYRTWIGPDLYAPPSFELYKANRDPAMEAIMAYSGPPAL